ncbi:MAG: LysR substrate-binding domain-containing protein [Gammaproteobacteria bacterium]|nr:LysR substrate-binding domain-containing protein [Gammaproteobacteria bacterium]MCW8923497.1 LysR substrate-binding domain-containing protein [Gammaproteobacteria bacterium]
MISLKQITYALAVSKTLHFKQAAEQCSISQSALSTAINEMEKQLGFQVFERDNKKVLVTPIGELFLNKADSIKIQVNDLYLLGQTLKEPLSYPMSLGIIPTIGPYLLPEVLPEVRHQYPDFQLRIVEEQSNVLVGMVRRGELDTAILALPYDIEGLLAFEFWEEDFYWITHCEDRLAEQNEITSAELDQSQLMLLKDGHCLKEHALAACKLPVSKTDTLLASTSLNTLVQMVAGRMGTTLVPAMSLHQLLSGNPELRAVHLNEPGPHRKIAFITRANYPGVKSIELLMQLFRRQLPKTTH